MRCRIIYKIADLLGFLDVYCGSMPESGEKPILRGRESGSLSRFCTSHNRPTGINPENRIFTQGCASMNPGVREELSSDGGNFSLIYRVA